EHLSRGPRRPSAQLDLAGLDQLLDLRPRPPRASLRQEAIEPHAVLVLADAQTQPRAQRLRQGALGIDVGVRGPAMAADRGGRRSLRPPVALPLHGAGPAGGVAR